MGLNLPKMFVDEARPGIVRYVEDPTVGMLVGINARDVVTACNLHAELVAALKGVVAVADRRTVEFDAARAAIAKAEFMSP